MAELIQRISIPGFIQIVVEIWNSVFLVIMIISLALGVRQGKNSYHADDYKTPFSREILLFFVAVYLYNAFDIAISLFLGIPGEWFVALNYAVCIGYLALAAIGGLAVGIVGTTAVILPKLKKKREEEAA